MTEEMMITDNKDGVIATRNRISVTVDRESNVVSMKDLEYTFEDIFALAEKLKGSNSHVWCFVGEMSSETGAFHENVKYSTAHNLPITWVIEDNGKSVCTDTRETWNMKNLSYEEFDLLNSRGNVIYYKYDTKYPHAGAGKRIQF